MSNAAEFIKSNIRVLTRAFDDPLGEFSRNRYMGKYDIVRDSRTLNPTHTASEYQNLVNIGKEARRRSIVERSSRNPTNKRSSVNPHPVLETVDSSVEVWPSDGTWDGIYSDPLIHKIMYNANL